MQIFHKMWGELQEKKTGTEIEDITIPECGLEIAVCGRILAVECSLNACQIIS